MANHINVEDLKKEYIGKTINWLTIIDIFRNENNIIIFRCKCRCGNVKDIVKKCLLGKQPPISCGCYRYSNEHSAQLKEYFADPEVRRRLSESKKKWAKENPDKVKLNGEKCREFYNKHPEKRREVGSRLSKWYKNHPDKSVEKSKAHSEWYKNNPEKVKESTDKRLKYLKDHPEIENERRRKISLHSNEVKEHINELNSQKAHEKRKQSNYDVLLDVIYSSYVDDLLNGNIKAGDVIETMCPNCGKYAEHVINSIYVLSTSNFKLGKAPLCKQCHVALTSCFSSKFEDDIAEYISKFYSGKLIKNDRLILNGKELDLYYPEKKIAIEFNGDYWHDDNHKQPNYHYNKFISCREKGILLISIFESEWISRQEEIKDYIKDVFNNVENKLSFIDSNTMNNNYPSFKYLNESHEHIEDSYTTEKGTVYTCGFSRIS